MAMVSKEKLQALEVGGEGNLLLKEDEEALWRKVTYFQRLAFLSAIPLLIALWIWMQGGLLNTSDEPDLPRAVISWTAFLMAWIIVSIMVYFLSIQMAMENLKFYDNGIQFSQLDWIKGQFTVHLPWSELGPYRRRRHWRLGDIIEVPRFGIIILESMKG